MLAPRIEQLPEVEGLSRTGTTGEVPDLAAASDHVALVRRWHDEFHGAPQSPKSIVSWLPYLWRRVSFPGHMAHDTGWRWRSLLTLLVLSGLLLLPWLRFPLFEPDEGRYAQIPAEMLARGNWLVPTLQGEPYLDKPPLFYWTVMLAYSIFGTQDWAARLVPALAVQLSILMTYAFGRRLIGERAAFWGALSLTLAPLFVGMGRILLLDGLLTLWVTMALLAAFLAVQRLELHRGWWLLTGIVCGLGVLTKGPVAVVLVVPPLLAHRWLAGKQAVIGWRGWAALGAIVAIMNAPWYLAIAGRLPEFGGYFFWKHNVLRFVQPFDHERPVWYYLPLLLAGMLPLTLLAIPMLRWLASGHDATARQRCPALGYLLLAAGWCVFFFSLSGSKLPTYILPALPMGCLALGVYLDRSGWRQSSWARGTAVATYLSLLIAHAWLVPAIAAERSPMNTAPEVQAWCRDRELPVFCFPRHVDSMAFYAGRADFRTFRSKELATMLAELDQLPRAVVLFAHRNSLDTLRRCLPPQLRVTEERPLGLCAMAIVERRN